MPPTNKKQPSVTMDSLIVRLSSVLTNTETLEIANIGAVSRYGGGDAGEVENVLIITFRRPSKAHIKAWDNFSTSLVRLYDKKRTASGDEIRWGVSVFEHKMMSPTSKNDVVIAAELHLSWKTPTKSSFAAKATKQESALVLYVRENLRNLDSTITELARLLNVYKKSNSKEEDPGVDIVVGMGQMGDNIYTEMAKNQVSGSRTDERPEVPKGVIPRSGVVNIDNVVVLGPGRSS